MAIGTHLDDLFVPNRFCGARFMTVQALELVLKEIRNSLSGRMVPLLVRDLRDCNWKRMRDLRDHDREIYMAFSSFGCLIGNTICGFCGQKEIIKYNFGFGCDLRSIKDAHFPAYDVSHTALLNLSIIKTTKTKTRLTITHHCSSPLHHV
jgi:hypothetical protein